MCPNPQLPPELWTKVFHSTPPPYQELTRPNFESHIHHWPPEPMMAIDRGVFDARQSLVHTSRLLWSIGRDIVYHDIPIHSTSDAANLLALHKRLEASDEKLSVLGPWVHTIRLQRIEPGISQPLAPILRLCSNLHALIIDVGDGWYTTADELSIINSLHRNITTLRIAHFSLNRRIIPAALSQFTSLTCLEIVYYEPPSYRVARAKQQLMNRFWRSRKLGTIPPSVKYFRLPVIDGARSIQNFEGARWTLGGVQHLWLDTIQITPVLFIGSAVVSLRLQTSLLSSELSFVLQMMPSLQELEQRGFTRRLQLSAHPEDDWDFFHHSLRRMSVDIKIRATREKSGIDDVVLADIHLPSRWFDDFQFPVSKFPAFEKLTLRMCYPPDMPIDLADKVTARAQERLQSILDPKWFQIIVV